MKVFKLAKAELAKLFQRPALFIMVGVLAIALVLTSLFYNPTLREDTRVNYSGSTLAEINASFITEKNTMLSSFQKSVDEINIFTYNATNNNTKLTEFRSHLANADSAFVAFNNELLKTNKSVTEARNKLSAYKTEIHNLQSFIANIETDLDFFITKQQASSLKIFFDLIYSEIPSNTMHYSIDDFIELWNFLLSERSFKDNVYPITNNLKAIAVDAKVVDKIIDEYYLSLISPTGKLATYEQEINDYYNNNIANNNKETLATLNTMFSNYKSIVNMASSNLENEFTLLKIGDITSSQINSYIGFSKVNKYSLQENITKNKFLLDNNQNDINYSNNLSFSTTAGFATSAYDFSVFAMQILSIIIAVFCLFFGASLIAGEQSGGTMKMLAIRPYTRNKIFIGKFIACISFMLILLTISFVASFVVGAALFGINLPNILLIFNATTPIVVSPIIALLIYALSVILNLIFYISLAMLISVLFRSGTVAVLSSFIIYIATVVCNMLLSGIAWFKFLPIAHLDLFKFFGGASISGEILSFNLIIDANFMFSAVYLLASILVFNIISLMAFRKRNIA